MIGGMLPRALGLTGLAALAACLLAACGGGGSSDASGTTTPAGTTTTAPAPTTTAPVAKTVTITVKNAVPVGGIQRATVSKGDEVTLVVHSDVADEVHVHGYNLMKDVAAGGTAKITFVANVPGRFEAELEQHGTQIADLTVNP
jgi:hypothetical protein